MIQDPLSRLINDLTELDRTIEQKVKDSSPEELLSIGRKFMDDSEYSEAKIIFKKLYKTGGIFMKEISSLYDFLIYSLTKRIPDNIIIEGVIRCMATATEMHAEKTLPKEDLFTIDTLIDRVVSEDILIPHREEFEGLYYKFKEYTIKAFLEGKNLKCPKTS